MVRSADKLGGRSGVEVECEAGLACLISQNCNVKQGLSEALYLILDWLYCVKLDWN